MGQSPVPESSDSPCTALAPPKDIHSTFSLFERKASPFERPPQFARWASLSNFPFKGTGYFLLKVGFCPPTGELFGLADFPRFPPRTHLNVPAMPEAPPTG